MTKYRKETSGVLVFGTEGEENLYNARAEVFVNAKHPRCDIHLRDNVKRKERLRLYKRWPCSAYILNRVN